MVTMREAATVMLVRDEPDLHVFMLRRNLDADFIGGAYVFPGGAVDPADRAPEMLARCRGRSDAEASAHLGLESGGLGFWVAAIRETFEEAGVLLARDTATGELVDVAEPGGADRLADVRQAMAAGDHAFLDAIEGEDLLLDVGALHVFSHWITPTGMPRRYDTWFFVAEAPEGHAYLHDDGETVASVWIRPSDALERAKRRELEIIFPTLRNLEALARFETADELVATVRNATSVPTTQPRIVADHTGTRLLLPGDPGYDEAEDLPDDSLPRLNTADLAAAAQRVEREGHVGGGST
jgi:8-oxo-dGTP pyrophosphatase MutT (NUDIX family)